MGRLHIPFFSTLKHSQLSADNEAVAFHIVPKLGRMRDGVTLLEATLELMEEGIAVLDAQSIVAHWNHMAMELTGYSAADVVGKKCPEDMFHLNQEHQDQVAASILARRRARARGVRMYAGFYSRTLDEQEQSAEKQISTRPMLVSIRHKLGHSVPGMLHKAALQDVDGSNIGQALLFYPVEEIAALPHGGSEEGAEVEAGQAEMEDRLAAAYHQWLTSGLPMSVLWIRVDQAHTLRKTHGREACEEMLHRVSDTLLRQKMPTETLGRWGDDEFLIISHERSAEVLLQHAQRLAGLARTVDFQWWGDRVELTISIGLAHATADAKLESLLEQAQQAMHNSEFAGGNRVAEARSA
jgi:diguanylate cyclase (GGDEF)-like protein